MSDNGMRRLEAFLHFRLLLAATQRRERLRFRRWTEMCSHDPHHVDADRDTVGSSDEDCEGKKDLRDGFNGVSLSVEFIYHSSLSIFLPPLTPTP